MAATVTIVRITGSSGSPTATDITSTNTRLSVSDNPTPGNSNPIPIPSSGTNYSYWCTTRLNCTVAPTGTINNIRWYTDGVNGLGTGVGVKVAQASSYVQATGTDTSGDELSQGNHGGLTDAPADAFTFTSASPLEVDGSTEGTGQFGNYVVFQTSVGSTASPGTTAQETATWVYDET